jgi:hypothetical protein
MTEQNQTRKIYKPTKGFEKKIARWDAQREASGGGCMPTDDEFKTRWAKKHGGKTRGWGLLKRDYVLGGMTTTREYQMGLWQGRVDKARGLEYSEERNENTYNLGYYRGYDEYESNRRGWDSATRQRFDEKYINS